jgi:hypothetical protein
MKDHLDALQLNIDPLESALSIGYAVRGLVGHRFLPAYRVGSPTVKAKVYGTEGFQLVDAKRALRAEPKEVDFTVSETTKRLTEYTLQVPLDTREEEAAAIGSIDARGRARTVAQRHVAISREYDIASTLTTAGNYASGNSTTITDQWNDFTSGVSDHDPITAIDTAKSVIRQKTGMEPNYCLMGRTTWNAVKNNTYILARLPGGTGADTKTKFASVDSVRDLLELDELMVADSVYHTGSAFADIWSDVCILAYINPNPTEEEEPTFGFTLTREYGEVDGLPLLGVAGIYQKSPWVTGVWYGEERLPWIALDTAGYLMLDTCS